MATSEALLIVFDVPLKLKVTFLSSEIPNLSITRTANTLLTDLYQHLENSLNISSKQVLSILPIAICTSTYSDNYTRLPLVSEHIWRYLIDKHPFNNVKIILNKRPSIDVFLPEWIPLHIKEIRMLDMSYYMPRVLNHNHIVSLGEKILHHDYYIKPQLRRGLWMHLLGVFHPALKTLDQRELYIQHLRRVYDNLKGKLGDENTWSVQVRHLRESIHRDAIRTDPSEEFLTTNSNLQKLVNIVTVYTLEHSEIKYTQGMTDLLSPILYVMEREDDAYICFAAMFERIKVNFTEWCEGTLNKLERLKHLCEVLDPELYKHLIQQQTEDPFVLFFGMVLIECRREFNFSDGLHLMEVLWAAALHRDAPSLQQTSQAKWALFMSTVSMEIVYQAFGEIEAPYSTHPLEESIDDVILLSHHSRSSSRCIPTPPTGSTRSRTVSSEKISELTSSQLPIKRSTSLPDNGVGYVLIQSHEAKSDGDLHKCDDDEIHDTTNKELLDCKTKSVLHTTEMADMSSVSSNCQYVQNNSDDTPLSHDHPSSNGLLEHVLELDDEPRVSNDHVIERRSQTMPRQMKHPIIDEHNDWSSSLPRVSKISLPPAAFLHHLSRPSLSSPYVSGIRALDPRISYPNITTIDPFEELDSQSPCSSPLRLSPFSTSQSSRNSPPSLSLSPSPLPHLLQDNNSINNFTLSMEASMEVPELLSGSQSHPNVNRETSLQIKMAEAFSLFVCLAILVQNRNTILSDRLDFVGLSGLLNAQAESQSLPRILKLARHLHRVYYQYQMTYFGNTDIAMFETWLDDPSVVTMATTRQM